MKTISVFIGIFFIFCLTFFSISNHALAEVFLWPFSFYAQVPLYILVLITGIFSFICGGLFVWFSDVSIRIDRYRKSKQIQALEKQLK